MRYKDKVVIFHIKSIFIMCCVLIYSSLMVVSSINGIVNTNKLHDHSIKTTAYITNKTIFHSRSKSYEVKYDFHVNGKTYSYSDPIGRKNLWTSIPEDTYKELQIGDPITVYYYSLNPWINQSIYKYSKPNNVISNYLLGWLIGVLSISSCIIILVFDFKKVKKRWNKKTTKLTLCTLIRDDKKRNSK